MLITFRSKLSLLLISIIIVLLGGVFSLVQYNLERKFTQSIEVDLQEARALVLARMQERHGMLRHFARVLTGNRLILAILTDTSLDRITRNDILSDEVLPNFSQVDTLLVASVTSEILGVNSSKEGKWLAEALPSMPLFEKVMSGKRGSAFLIKHSRCVQIVGTPVFTRREMVGALFVGKELTEAQLRAIKRSTKVDLAFINKGRFFLSSDWDREPESRRTLLSALEQSIQTKSTQNRGAVSDQLYSFVWQNERFLYSQVIKPGSFVPNFAIGSSLDRELAFVVRIRNDTLLTGIFGVAIGILVALWFSRSISRPIGQLQQAAGAVAQGNFCHRVRINTRDEFSRLGDSFNAMVAGLEDRERIRSVMNKVVSKEVADIMLSKEIQLGGEECEGTILFSDIRGFTGFSEGMPPQALLSYLNRYFTKVSACVDTHQGVIDKYIGDAVMALFGVPNNRGTSARDAVFAAQDMLQAVEDFNGEEVQAQTLKIGIGINSGLLVAGMVGAENRLDYTVLGDAVNLASRLEGLTSQYGASILVSEETHKLLLQQRTMGDRQLLSRQLDSVRVKGKRDGVPIYQILSLREQQSCLAERLAFFQEGRLRMQEGRHQQALEVFRDLCQQCLLDRVAAVYLQRCERYVEHPALFKQDYENGIYVSRVK